MAKGKNQYVVPTKDGWGGKESWLSCCPVEIWSVCHWSLVKISVSFCVYGRPFGRCCVVF